MTKTKVSHRFHMVTKYVDEIVTVRQSRYLNGSIKALVIDSDEGVPVGTATVNLEGQGLIPEDGHVFIKDYSENEGVLASLVENKIVSEPVREVPCGFVIAYECKLLF